MRVVTLRPTLASSRGTLPKNFLTFLSAPPPTPPPKGEKIWKENFWSATALQSYKKSVYLTCLFIALFSVLCAVPRRSHHRALCQFCTRSPHTSTSHRHAHIRSRSLLGVVCVRLVTSLEFVGFSMVRASRGQGVCACPTHPCAHKPTSLFLKEIVKQ
jgi:hypothetical protein